MSIPNEAGPSTAGPAPRTSPMSIPDEAGPSTAGPSTGGYYMSPYGPDPSMPGPSRRKSRKRQSAHDLPISLSPVAEPPDFPADKEPWVTALIESSGGTLLDGEDEISEEVKKEIQMLNDLSGQHSRASEAAILSSPAGKGKQVALRPKDSDTLNLAHKIDGLLKKGKSKQQEQPQPTRSPPSSRSSPRASAQYSPQGRPAQPVSAHQSPRGQPAQPTSAQRSPQGRPAQPTSAQRSPQGWPAQPISAQTSPQGRPVQPASAQRSPQWMSVPRSPQGRSAQSVSGQIPLEWSPDQNVPRSQYYAPSSRPLRLTASPQRPQQQQEQQQDEDDSEEGEDMNSHQQEHCIRMLQEANLWPLARLEQALASQTLSYVPERGPGGNISTSNQVGNLGDVVESAEDNLDSEAEAAADTENAATKKSPVAKMKKWFQKSRSP
ncbi:hypothetical protein GGI42DRAFT_359712 [Trichoderma sp. SZMC 28013]